MVARFDSVFLCICSPFLATSRRGLPRLPPVESAARPGAKSETAECELTADICRLDDTEQRSPSIRRQLVTLVEQLRIDDEARLRIPDDDVRVIAGFEPPLLSFEAGESGRAFAHP